MTPYEKKDGVLYVVNLVVKEYKWSLLCTQVYYDKELKQFQLLEFDTGNTLIVNRKKITYMSIKEKPI